MQQHILELIACMAAGFLLGSVPFGLIIARTFKGIDPRKAGSGNIGSTNVARLCGRACGLMTLFCDIMKGVLPSLLGLLLLPDDPFLQSLVAFSAVLGHIKSPFLGFKGGKGVATTIGALIPLAFLPLLCSVACFFAVFAVTRYVSLSSMAMSGALVIFCAAFGRTGLLPLTLTLFAFIIWAHRSNIRRLLKGEESKFVLHK